MSETGLSNNSIERLAWQILGSLLARIDGDLFVGDLHPGGGQYDCLSLITSTPNPLVMLNRAGDSALIGDAVVEDIWLKGVREKADKTALYILEKSNLTINDANAERNKDLILTCKRMARWVQSQRKLEAKPICCWIDDTYFVGPATSLLEQVRIPDEWKTQAPPYESSDWSAWLYALTVEGKVTGLVNMKSGDAINSDGSKLDAWYEKFVPPPIKKSFEKPAYITFPLEIPTDEILAIFRKVANFNGYKVFGDELATIATSTFENWDKTNELPRDINLIKGALFFEFRRSHHTDQYPEGRELLYVKALAEAIDKYSE
jgi:hypothetical protein